MRISTWSGPRNISTALMYSFAQRSDTEVVDEPIYAHYLSTTNADNYHPGAAETLATQDNNIENVIRDVVLGPHEQPVIFFKNMTHHLVNMDWSFMDRLCNILLTRDPREVLLSYTKNVKQPILRDTGYAEQAQLLNYLREIGQEPPVLDAKAFLLNPRGVLTQLCDRINLPFEEAMLSWSPGARVEDGAWAKYWYANVHQSTGFQPYRPKEEALPAHLEPLLEECLPYYERMSALAIR